MHVIGGKKATSQNIFKNNSVTRLLLYRHLELQAVAFLWLTTALSTIQRFLPILKDSCH